VELPATQRSILLDLARASIRHGLAHGKELPVNEAEYEPALRESRATFVTLRLRGRLQGCIGMLHATRPLVRDVAHNAYAAAFDDPRGEELNEANIAALDIHISMLTAPEALSVASEEELLRVIRPGIDGLILEDGYHRGTLLPSVWESLPEPRAFIRHVKVKAGLREDYWSAEMKASRYQTESFGKE
jgi:AmmeMemoRadiSam system protein A